MANQVAMVATGGVQLQTNDFMADVNEQTTSYSFDVDGEKIQLKLAPNSYFPYISADDQLANPVFTVSKLTNTEMVLLYEGNGITWRFMLTSKDEGEEAQPEAKVDWDYASAANLWKAVDEGSAFEAMGYYFADNNWSPIAYTEATHTGDAYELTLPDSGRVSSTSIPSSQHQLRRPITSIW